MITQTFDLNLIPDSAPVVAHCDQYDKGTGRLVINLYDGAIAYSPSGTAVIQGTKPDGRGFDYACTMSGNVVTANLTEQMTAVAGQVRTQIVVTESTGRTGTFVFILDVQRSALPADTDMSESDYQLIEQAIEDAQQAVTDAEGYAEDAEAWSVGKRGGQDVPSTDPTYQNNSKYWAGVAQQVAQGGLIYKGSCLFANIPASGMTAGDMWNIEDDFVTDSRFQEGSGKSVAAGSNIAWNTNNKWDVLAMVKVSSLNDLTNVDISSPSANDFLGYDPLSSEWKNIPISIAPMTASNLGIGKPDTITTTVDNTGTFSAKGVGIVADVNSGGTQYGNDWLYYTGTTTVITPESDKMYRVTISGTAYLYYWSGSAYTMLASQGGGGGASLVDVTTAQYNALTPQEKADATKWYWINDMDGNAGSYIVVGALAGLTDTAISSPSNGQVLTYDSTSQKWKNANPSGGADDLNDLTDVALSSPTNGQVLTYDSSASKWKNATPSGGGGSLSVSVTEDQAYASGVSIAGNSTERLFFDKPSNFIGFIGADPNSSSVAIQAVKNSSNEVGVTFINLTGSSVTIYPVAYFVTATIS